MFEWFNNLEWTKGTMMFYAGFAIFGLGILLIIIDIIVSRISGRNQRRKELLEEQRELEERRALIAAIGSFGCLVVRS